MMLKGVSVKRPDKRFRIDPPNFGLRFESASDLVIAEDTSENAKNMVTESFEEHQEQKGKVSAKATVEDNIENAFKQHAAKAAEQTLAKIEAKTKVAEANAHDEVHARVFGKTISGCGKVKSQS